MGAAQNASSLNVAVYVAESLSRSEALHSISFRGSAFYLVPRLCLLSRSEALPSFSFRGSAFFLVPRLCLLSRSEALPWNALHRGSCLS